MAKILRSGGDNKDFKLPSSGKQKGRISRVVGIGTHENNYKGETKIVKPAYFMFELAEDKVEIKGDMLPQFISMKVNFSAHQQSKMYALAKELEILEDDGSIDVEKFIGKAVNLKIVHSKSQDGREFAFVENVSAVDPELEDKVPKLVADSYFFDFDEPDAKILDSFSDFRKKQLMSALNYKGSKVEKLLGESSTVSESDIGIE